MRLYVVSVALLLSSCTAPPRTVPQPREYFPLIPAWKEWAERHSPDEVRARMLAPSTATFGRIRSIIPSYDPERNETRLVVMGDVEGTNPYGGRVEKGYSVVWVQPGRTTTASNWRLDSVMIGAEIVYSGGP
jgi:hypothetical protein